MKKRNIVLYYILSIFTFVLMSIIILLMINAKKEIPSVVQLNRNITESNYGATIKSFETIVEEFSLEDATFTKEDRLAEMKGYTFLPVWTDSHFFQVGSISYKGTCITDDMIKNGSKYAVISSKLAVKLFLNSNAVGNTIEINGTDYTVCGVYKFNSNLINDMSSDIYDRVYLPYTSKENYENEIIDSIFYSVNSESAVTLSQYMPSNYSIINFSEKNMVLQDFLHIMNFILFLILSIGGLKIWYFILKALVLKVHNNLANFYLKEIFTNNLVYLITMSVFILGIPIVLLITFFNMDLGIYIIPKYLPTDNIFDLSFYIQSLISNAQKNNTVMQYGNLYWTQLYVNTFNVIFWAVSLFIFSFLVWIYLFKKVHRVDKLLSGSLILYAILLSVVLITFSVFTQNNIFSEIAFSVIFITVIMVVYCICCWCEDKI